jgi:hypothetical protein
MANDINTFAILNGNDSIKIHDIVNKSTSYPEYNENDEIKLIDVNINNNIITNELVIYATNIDTHLISHLFKLKLNN